LSAKKDKSINVVKGKPTSNGKRGRPSKVVVSQAPVVVKPITVAKTTKSKTTKSAEPKASSGKRGRPSKKSAPPENSNLS